MNCDEWIRALWPVGGSYIPDEARRLYRLTQETPEPLWIVEVGSYAGFSGLMMAAASLERESSRLVLVDSWGVYPHGSSDLDHLVRLLGHAQSVGLHGRFSTMRMKSTEAAAVWPPEAKIGLLHIDADHTQKALLEDVEAWQRHLAPGAALVLHDCYYFYDDMDLAVTEIRSRPEWSGWEIVETQGLLRWKETL